MLEIEKVGNRKVFIELLKHDGIFLHRVLIIRYSLHDVIDICLGDYSGSSED